jgi:hypothetical protein
MFSISEQETIMNTYGETKWHVEDEILEQAVKAFERETGARARTHARPHQVLLTREDVALRAPVGNQIIDHPAQLWRVDTKLQLEAEGRIIEYQVELKRTLNDVVVGRLAQQFAQHPGRWLVVTRHVPRSLARKMRDMRMQFIDTVGNAYIDEPPTFILIKGNRAPPRARGFGVRGAFGHAGLRLVFALLCKPELGNATYREVAGAANVALGTVAQVFNDLMVQGYLLDMGKRGRRLTKRRGLLDTWVEAYAGRLRPKTLLGRYATDRPGFWLDADLCPDNAQWGAEVAAHKLTRYLKPEIITIYARKPVNDIVLRFRLRGREGGMIEIRQKFWDFQTEEVPPDIVPPLLVFADLVATGDRRNVGAAGIVYDKYLQRHFGED